RDSRHDEFYVPMNRQRVPMEEIAPPRGAINRNLKRPENEASEGIACVTGARQVAPRASRVAGVNADAVAMNATRRFALHLFARRAPQVAQEQLVRSQGDCLADFARCETFRQRCGGGVRGLFGSRFENRLTKLIDPRIVCRSSARRLVQKLMLFEHFWQNSASLRRRRRAGPRFGFDTVPDRLPQQGV